MKKIDLGVVLLVGVGMVCLAQVVSSQEAPVEVTKGEEASLTAPVSKKDKTSNVTVSSLNETTTVEIQADQRVELSNLGSELVISGPDWTMPEENTR